LILGFALTVLLFEVMFPALIPQEAGKNLLDDYGIGYTLGTALPIAMIFVAWLDYFMDTRIHAD